MELLVTIAIIVLGIVILVASRRAGGTRRSVVHPPRGTATDADVEQFLRAGRKMGAIKLYREIHDVDLKAAKEAVERLAKEIARQRP